MPGRFPVIPDTIVSGQALTFGGKTQISQQFPIGPGIYEMWLRFKLNVTIGTGAGPISEGELNIIRQLFMKSDMGEVFLDNVPGRGMFKVGIPKCRTVPRKDAIAAATATYTVDLPIFFVDWDSAKPEDTVIDTSRYRSMTFEVIMGTLADLFTAPGTATLTGTLDVTLRRSKFRWNSVEAPPVGFIQYSGRNPVDAATTTEIKLEVASDLTYKRLYVHSSTSGVSGQPFYGANSDAIIDLMTLKDGDTDWIKAVNWLALQDINKADFHLETVPAGLGVMDFIHDGSLKSGLYAGDKNELRLTWTNQSAPAANSIVSLLTEGYRALRQQAA